MEERRKCTTVRQLELLVGFLEGYPDLALGRVRSKEARAVASSLWQECADILNAEGPSRSAKEWPKSENLCGMQGAILPLKFSQVWNDLKCRLRVKLTNINSNQQGTNIGHSYATLTPVEVRVASILCRDNGPLPNVRQNQLDAPNDDECAMEKLEVVVNDNTDETKKHFQEVLVKLEPLQEAQTEAASPAPSLNGEVPPSTSPRSKRLRGHQRRENGSRQHRARTLLSTLDESRAMMLRIETLRAEAALQNAQALNCFAEGFRLIAQSIDRFSQVYSQQRDTEEQ